LRNPVFGNFLDISRKTITFFWQGFDKFLFAGIIAERFPQSRDITVQASFFDKGINPNLSNQFFLFDRFPFVFKQDYQYIEDFRRERHKLSVSPELSFGDINPERIELIKTF